MQRRTIMHSFEFNISLLYYRDIYVTGFFLSLWEIGQFRFPTSLERFEIFSGTNGIQFPIFLSYTYSYFHSEKKRSHVSLTLDTYPCFYTHFFLWHNCIAPNYRAIFVTEKWLRSRATLFFFYRETKLTLYHRVNGATRPSIACS